MINLLDISWTTFMFIFVTDQALQAFKPPLPVQLILILIYFIVAHQ